MANLDDDRAMFESVPTGVSSSPPSPAVPARAGDLVCVSEFSEREGPVPLEVLPRECDTKFDLNTFVLRIMAVDSSFESSHPKLNKENIDIIQLPHEDASAFVLHLSLLDLAARGYVRSICLSYIAHDSSKLFSNFDALSSTFDAVAKSLKRANHRLFRDDLDCRLVELLRELDEGGDGSVDVAAESSTDERAVDQERVWALKSRLGMTDEEEVIPIVPGRAPRRRMVDASVDKIVSQLAQARSSIESAQLSGESAIAESEPLYPLAMLLAKDRDFTGYLRTLPQLCGEQVYTEALERLAQLHEYFDRPVPLLDLEQVDLARLRPATTLLCVGHSPVMNFDWRTERHARLATAHLQRLRRQKKTSSREQQLAQQHEKEKDHEQQRRTRRSTASSNTHANDGSIETHSARSHSTASYESARGEHSHASPLSSLTDPAEESDPTHSLDPLRTPRRRSFASPQAIRVFVPVSPYVKGYRQSRRIGALAFPTGDSLGRLLVPCPPVCDAHATIRLQSPAPPSSSSPEPSDDGSNNSDTAGDGGGGGGGDDAEVVDDGDGATESLARVSLSPPQQLSATEAFAHDHEHAPEALELRSFATTLWPGSTKMSRAPLIPPSHQQLDSDSPSSSDSEVFRSAGRGLLAISRRFSWFPHLVYSILKGRPVVIRGSPSLREEVDSFIEACAFLIPGHWRSPLVRHWSETPVHMTDLRTLKLIGVSKKVALSRTLEHYASVVDFDNQTLLSPPYNKGMFVSDFLATRNWPSEETFLAHLSTQLAEISLYACLYFHLCCAGVPWTPFDAQQRRYINQTSRESGRTLFGRAKSRSRSSKSHAGVALHSYAGFESHDWAQVAHTPRRSRQTVQMPVTILSRKAFLRMIPIRSVDMEIVENLCEVVKEQQLMDHGSDEMHCPVIRLDLAQHLCFPNKFRSRTNLRRSGGVSTPIIKTTPAPQRSVKKS